MSEMVKRVALAICKAGGCGCTVENEHVLCTDARLSDNLRETESCACCVEARAAIEAMREPTDAMSKAAWSRYEQGHIKTAWRIMIDEALR